MYNILGIVFYFAAAICLVFSIALVCYLLGKDIKYLAEKQRYGKIEGTITRKYKELGIKVGPVAPYEYYFELQKETKDGVISRSFLVSEFNYNKYEVGDKIKKETFKVIQKI